MTWLLYQLGILRLLGRIGSWAWRHHERFYVAQCRASTLRRFPIGSEVVILTGRHAGERRKIVAYCDEPGDLKLDGEGSATYALPENLKRVE